MFERHDPHDPASHPGDDAAPDATAYGSTDVSPSAPAETWSAGDAAADFLGLDQEVRAPGALGGSGATPAGHDLLADASQSWLLALSEDRPLAQPAPRPSPLRAPTFEETEGYETEGETEGDDEDDDARREATEAEFEAVERRLRGSSATRWIARAAVLLVLLGGGGAAYFAHQRGLLDPLLERVGLAPATTEVAVQPPRPRVAPEPPIPAADPTADPATGATAAADPATTHSGPTPGDAEPTADPAADPALDPAVAVEPTPPDPAPALDPDPTSGSLPEPAHDPLAHAVPPPDAPGPAPAPGLRPYDGQAWLPSHDASGATPPPTNGVRRATQADMAGVWIGETIPMEAVHGGARLLTPKVGRVRAVLQGGEMFEGRLYSVGSGQVWLETELGRMGLEVASLRRLDQLSVSETAPKMGAKGTEVLAGLPRVRVRLPGGVFYGQVVDRDGERITLVTDEGAKVTLEGGEVDPAPRGTDVIVKGPVKKLGAH